MRSVLLLAIALIPFLGNAQQAEFEGEIRYLHYFRYKKFVMDTGMVVRQFGNSSYYLYKKGNYVWKFNGSDLQTEYSFNSSRKIFAKKKNNDTLFVSKPVITDTILRYDIKKNADTILGIPVNMLTIVTANKANRKNEITRRIFYNAKYPVLPQHASHLYSYANNEVFKLIKAIPLRIEMESEFWPFVVRYQAVRIIPRTITPAELQLPKGAKYKN